MESLVVPEPGAVVLSCRSAYPAWALIRLVMLGLSIYLSSDNFQLGQVGRRFLAVGTITLFSIYIALVQGSRHGTGQPDSLGSGLREACRP